MSSLVSLVCRDGRSRCLATSSASIAATVSAVIVGCMLLPASGSAAMPTQRAAKGAQLPRVPPIPPPLVMPNAAKAGTAPQSASANPNPALLRTAAFAYQNGSVQTAPKLYLLWWGSAWKSTGVKFGLEIFYKNLEQEPFEGPARGEESWEGILNQYTQRLGPYHDATIVKPERHVETLSHPAGVEEGTVKAEVNEWLKEASITPEVNDQFVVLAAPGSTYTQREREKGACGYHGIGEYEGKEYAYTLVAYAGDLPNCNYLSYKEFTKEKELNHRDQLDSSTTVVASHEFAESVSDPQLPREVVNAQGQHAFVRTGWKDETPGIKTGGEIGDLCNEQEKETAEQREKEESKGKEPKEPQYHAGQELPPRLEGGAFVNTLQDNIDGNTCRVQDPPAITPPAPTAITEGANAEATSATLQGKVNPNGPVTSYYFRYGTTTSYGSFAPAPPPGYEAGFGESLISVEASASGLAPNTTYHYQLAAGSWAGTSYGEDRTFKTPAWSIQTAAEPPPPASDVNLDAVRCSSSSSCTAVGHYFESEKERFYGLADVLTGATWTYAQMPTGGPRYVQMRGVSCKSSTCMAVGEGYTGGPAHALIDRWTGTEWQNMEAPKVEHALQSTLTAVSCPSTTFCIAVGNYYTGAHEAPQHPLLEKWNGSAWTVVAAPETTGSLAGVDCHSTTACLAVGLNNVSVSPLAERLASGKWKLESPVKPAGFQDVAGVETGLVSISCPTSTTCVTVGQYGTNGSQATQTLSESWNGKAWTLESTPNEGEPGPTGDGTTGVSCAAVGECTAVGHGANHGFAMRLKSGAWEMETVAQPAGVESSSLSGVSCWTGLDCIAVGEYMQESGKDEDPLIEKQELLN